jgi:hypothetical protein
LPFVAFVIWRERSKSRRTRAEAPSGASQTGIVLVGIVVGVVAFVALLLSVLRPINNSH